jgi:hypothetical protein
MTFSATFRCGRSLAGLVDHAHAATPNLAEDFVALDGFADLRIGLRSAAGTRGPEQRLVVSGLFDLAEELLVCPARLDPPTAVFADRDVLLCAALFLGRKRPCQQAFDLSGHQAIRHKRVLLGTSPAPPTQGHNLTSGQA